MLVTTFIGLPPGGIPEEKIKIILEQSISEWKWINPEKYGHITADQKLGKDDSGILKILLEFYRNKKDLELKGKYKGGSARLSILPNRFNRRNFSGYIIYESKYHSETYEVKKYAEEVASIMELVNSPMAYSCAREAFTHFRTRTVRAEYGEEEVINVKDYSAGLPHPHWRMWFGEHYVDFIELNVLEKAPTNISKRIKNIYFVELFDKPSQWDQEPGKAAAQNFKGALREQIFFDYNEPDKELAAPNFSDLLELSDD